MTQLLRHSDELLNLAEIVARWVDDVPGVPAVYLFGSRVRGDHRPDSDVDLCVFLWEWSGCETTAWWQQQNSSDFAELKATLPGPLKIHRDDHDAALSWVRQARHDPGRIAMQIRRAVCLWLPPRLTRSRERETPLAPERPKGP